MSKPRRASPFAVRDEFLDLDFPSVAATHAYANHPSMHRLSSEHLELVVKYFLRIREEFSWELHTKTERERLDICQFVRAYFEHVGAVDRQFIGDAPAGDFDYLFAEAEPTLEAHSVHYYVAVPPVLISHLEQYCAFRLDAVELAGTPDGLLRYVITILRGFAHVLWLCIPADALSFDLPVATPDGDTVVQVPQG
ncbi:hypothetical protein DFH09DRAFT_1090027 [Mycena vulgaris]|nr:hypothetical protein DFH09DRAFT_1090027 [Mycena vulgaris]